MTKNKGFYDFGGKVPPQAIEIEEAILGAIINDNAFSRVAHYFNDDVFYKESHQKIMNAIKQIYEKGGSIDILTVTDQLARNSDLDIIGGPVCLTDICSRVVNSSHLEFHCMLITDKFLMRELIRIGYEMAKKAYSEEDPSETAEWAENELLERFDLSSEDRASFKDALHSTLTDIARKAEGLITSFIKTGDDEIDSKVSLRERQILLIGGAEGSGKTKFAIHIAKGMLDNNENLRILWFSMEDSKEQIVRSFIAMGSMLTTKQQQSINYKLSEEDKQKIDDSVNNFKDYKIEFIDQVCSIGTIMRKARRFKEKYKDDIIAIIIDNLGLITTDSFYKGLEKDDYLAGKIKEFTDNTNACTIVLHHITKESARKFNLEEGYRPRKEYIKGSTRILDYVQQAVLVNLPRKYKDLVAEEKDRAKVTNMKEATGRFDKTRFIMEFWSINPQGDNETKGITDLREATWDELKFHAATETMPDGSQIRAGFLLRKYIEYSMYIDDLNRHREKKYHKGKVSIYTFIKTKKYTEDFKPKQDSRSYYLYGENINLSQRLNELFIAEIIKNRDGGSTEDQDILRYFADLDHNIFTAVEDKSAEKLLS